MIKKLSLFFSAIAIGILSIFGSISTKNTAEPQYFLENIQVKEQFNNSVETWTNTNVIELTSPRNNYEIDEWYELDDTNVNANLEIYLTTKELYNVNKYIFKTPTIEEYAVYITLYRNNAYAGITIGESGADEFLYEINYNYSLNKWELLPGLEVDLIIFTYSVDFESIVGQQSTQSFYEMGCIGLSVQNLVIPTIEYDPSEEPEETQQTTLEQISTIISDIINWFTNIFSGSSEIFYANNELTAWGTVLFIGIAIMLISICLKWVISLVRGV